MSNRFYEPTELQRFGPARAGDVNQNLSGIEAGFDAVQAELDATVPVLNETTMSQIGWTSPTLSAGEEFQMLAIPANGLIFPPNFANNVGYLRGTAPATDFVISIRHFLADGSNMGIIGTITIKANRTIVRATAGGLALSLPGGGALVFTGPASAQTVTYFAERMVPNV